MNLPRPSVKSQIRDPKTKVIYTVLAYRTLTRTELVQAVQVYHQSTKKKPKNGSEVTIHSIIGFDEG